MSQYSRRQGMADATSAISSYDSQIATLVNEQTKFTNSITEANSEILKAKKVVAQLLLPDLNPTTIELADSAMGSVMLASRYRELESENLARKSRMKQILLNPGFTDQITQNELEQGLLLSVESCRKDLDLAKQSLGKYQDGDLVWLRNNPVPKNNLSSISYWWAGNSKKRVNMLPVVLSRFNAKTLDEIYEAEKAASARVSQINSDLQAITQKLHDHQKTAKELTDLKQSTDSFEQESLESLRAYCVKIFQKLDVSRYQEQMESAKFEELKTQIGKIFGLSARIKMFSELNESIGKDLADRRSRKAGVEKVLRKWRKSSKTYLRSDKSNWLQATPQNQSQKTIARCQQYDTYHDCGSDFSDWILFYLIMNQFNSGEGKRIESEDLGYSIFSSHYSGSLPPAKFASEVMPESFQTVENQALLNEVLTETSGNSATFDAEIEGKAAEAMFEILDTDSDTENDSEGENLEDNDLS